MRWPFGAEALAAGIHAEVHAVSLIADSLADSLDADAVTLYKCGAVLHADAVR